MTISGQEAFITESRENVELDPLREDKQKIYEDILRYFEGRREGYIKVPTGWGKTFLSKHIMREYYRRGKFVLFLVSMNNPLLSQTYIDRKKGGPLFPNSSILSSEYKVDREELTEKLKKWQEGEGFVLFASLQTVLGKNNSEIKELVLEKADFVVVDEIHNFINNRGNDFLNEFGEKTRLFGMTATPFQGVVGNVKFVDEISGDMRGVYEKTLPECILDGELADLKYTITESDQDILEVFDFEKGLSELDRTDLFMDCSSVARIKQVVRRTRLAKDLYESQIKPGGSKPSAKTLVFCAPVRKQVYGVGDDKKTINAFHAKLAAALFNGDISAEEFEQDPDPSFPLHFENYSGDGGFREAAYISSELPKAEQQALLEAFKEVGKPPFVLCTVGMLIEGFDFPALENLVLLRPTLSMRLFEQQLGRVIRLSQATGKEQGRVFEVSDRVDSLYKRFGDNVFGSRKIEQIQMLQPEIRLEELFSEGDATRALKAGKIKISRLEFGARKKKGKPKEVPVRLPPTALRARYFSGLLALTEEKDIGLFEREKRELMRSALRFRVRGAKDAQEISELTGLANKLKREAYEDRRLKDNSRKYKPKVFGEIEWILKLRALNSLKYECTRLPVPEKNKILKTLGFEPDFRQIDSFRKKCLKIGSAQKTLPELFKVLTFVSRLSSGETYQFLDKKKKDQWKREFLPAVYWGSCFIEDSREMRELFESTEWDRQVKNLLRQK